MRLGTTAFVICLLPALVVPASAQIVRQMTIVPINFQNDKSEPRTLQQIREQFVASEDSNSTSWANFITEATNGLMRLDVTVLPYVTLPYDKRSGMTGAGTDLGCTAPGGASWAPIAIEAAKAAGHAIVGTPWVYSPQTFGMCSEVDRVGLMVDGRNFPFLYAVSIGLGRFMPAWTVICRDADGRFVTLSPDCRNDNRTFQSITGQGSGSFTVAERIALGTMPEGHVRTLTIDAPLPQTFTLAPMERTPRPGTIQGLTLHGYAIPVVAPRGITLEFHTRSKWGDWQTAGISGHIAGTSRLLDFSPDGRVVWPGQAGSSVLMPGSAYVGAGGLRITAGKITDAGISVTVDRVSDAASGPPPSVAR